MKKSSLLVLACAVACGAFAEKVADEEEVVKYATSPCSVAFAAPLQYPYEICDVEYFAYNLIYGECHNLSGWDLGLVSRAKGDVAGLQTMGLVSWSDSNLRGCQISGFGNAVFGNAKAFQLASVANYNSTDFVGAQIAAINYNGTLWGFQLGAFNFNKGASKALQIAAINANAGEYSGWSIGAVNCASRCHGFQMGVINTITDTGKAVQFGLFNSASNFSGLQFGLLNVIENAPIPVMVFMNAQL